MRASALGVSLVSVALLLAAGAASAQTAAVREACRPSAKLLCPKQVAAFDRDGVKACLLKQLDKVSPACAAAIKAAQPSKPQ